MKFLAWLEADRLAGGDGYLGPGPWITANPCLARPHIENSEAAKFNAVAGGKRLLEAFEDRIHRRFCFISRQPGPLDYMMDDVLFDQRSTPND